MVTVRLDVLQAENVKDNEKDSDCYVVATCDKKKQQTTVKRGTKNPVWNESFEWPSVPPDAVITLEVYDKDRFTRDDLLGKLSVPIHGFAPGSKTTVKRTLEERAKGCNGSLSFVVLVVDTRPIPSPVIISDAAPTHTAVHSTFTAPSAAFPAPVSPTLPTTDLRAELDKYRHQNQQQRITIDELKHLQADAVADYEKMKAERNAVLEQAALAASLRTDVDALQAQLKQAKWELEREKAEFEREKKELLNKLREAERLAEHEQVRGKEISSREAFLKQELTRLETEKNRLVDRERQREVEKEHEREEHRKEREREKEKERQREKEWQAEIHGYQEKGKQWDREREMYERQKLEWENELERLRALERQLAEERERMRNERIKERMDLERERQERAKRLDEMEADLEKRKKDMERKLKQQMLEAEKKRQAELDALRAEFERQKAGLEKAQRELEAERLARAREDQARKKEVQRGIADAIGRLTQSKLMRNTYNALLENAKAKIRQRKMELLKKELVELADDVQL